MAGRKIRSPPRRCTSLPMFGTPWKIAVVGGYHPAKTHPFTMRKGLHRPYPHDPLRVTRRVPTCLHSCPGPSGETTLAMSDLSPERTIQEFFIALISFFLLEPLQTAMADRMGDVSREQVASVTTCIREATPILIQQAYDAPWQTATQVVDIWSGMIPPEEILASATPFCDQTVNELRGSGRLGES